MERRVELVKMAYQKAKMLNEETKKVFNMGYKEIEYRKEILNNRLSQAHQSLARYLSNEYQNMLKEYIKGNVSKKDLNEAYIQKIKFIKVRRSKKAEQLGIEISKYGFPKFESKIDIFIPVEKFHEDRNSHFRFCNKQLKQKIEKNEELKKSFTKRQILQIIKMGKTPEGYTWHHDGNPPPGRMQLVKSDIHDKIRHDGGYSLWIDREGKNDE